jgi:hypothetical protein
MKYSFEFVNPNEMTKSEFDELNRVNEFDMFTPQQIGVCLSEVNSLIKKGETSELSKDEIDLVKSSTLELKNLKKYTVNEMINGRICKTDVFCMPKQVKWIDTFEKSESGENIVKGIFLDTQLNRDLGRVGQSFIKGKSFKKSDEEEQEEKGEEPEDKEKLSVEAMTKAIRKAIKKSDDSDEDIKEEVKKAFPKATEEDIDKAMKKAYKAIADDFMKKAEGDDEEQKEE